MSHGSRLWATVKQEAGTDKTPYPKHNPLTSSGKKVMASMAKEYGTKKGKEVFYASVNAGKPGSSKWHVKRGK